MVYIFLAKTYAVVGNNEILVVLLFDFYIYDSGAFVDKSVL